MSQEALLQRLEKQLADVHATNANLREQISSAQREIDNAKAIGAHAAGLQLQLEKAEARRKAAEDDAAAVQRKQRDAEREARHLRDENEELREQLERTLVEASRLAELDALIESAKHSGDLFAA
jgi:chromosome segregation ATPase